MWYFFGFQCVKLPDREVFSTENATPEKAEGKAITERPEDPARVTEEELQALLQELLTV